MMDNWQTVHQVNGIEVMHVTSQYAEVTMDTPTEWQKDY